MSKNDQIWHFYYIHSVQRSAMIVWSKNGSWWEWFILRGFESDWLTDLAATYIFRTLRTILPAHFTTVCLGLIFFNLYVSIEMLLKGMVESSLLWRDEPLTPNIDKVMTVWTFRRRAQNAKIGKIWQKVNFSDLVVSFFSRHSKEKNCRNCFQ